MNGSWGKNNKLFTSLVAWYKIYMWRYNHCMQKARNLQLPNWLLISNQAAVIVRTAEAIILQNCRNTYNIEVPVYHKVVPVCPWLQPINGYVCSYVACVEAQRCNTMSQHPGQWCHIIWQCDISSRFSREKESWQLHKPHFVSCIGSPLKKKWDSKLLAKPESCAHCWWGTRLHFSQPVWRSHPHVWTAEALQRNCSPDSFQMQHSPFTIHCWSFIM